VLLGVRADRPESQYGWIEPAHPIDFDKVELAMVTLVRRFWEKPHPDLAMKLWQRGFLWNSFVVVATTAALLDLFARVLPDLYIVLAPLLSVIATSCERERSAISTENSPRMTFQMLSRERRANVFTYFPLMASNGMTSASQAGLW
jgi:mannose-1-phosphate guanylyltransferase